MRAGLKFTLLISQLIQLRYSGTQTLVVQGYRELINVDLALPRLVKLIMSCDSSSDGTSLKEGKSLGSSVR